MLLKHDSFSPHLKLGDLFLALSLFLCLSVRLALSITNKDIPSHILHTFQKLSLYMTLGYTLSFYAASVILRNNISDVSPARKLSYTLPIIFLFLANTLELSHDKGQHLLQLLPRHTPINSPSLCSGHI